MSIAKEIIINDKKIREFGILMFVVLGVIVPVFILWKNEWIWKELATWFLAGGAIFLVGGLFLKKLFAPIYKGWMVFAIVLGIFVSSIIISLVYFFMITPIGFMRRTFGSSDPLQLKKSASDSDSYWIPREQITDMSRYQKLY